MMRDKTFERTGKETINKSDRQMRISKQNERKGTFAVEKFIAAKMKMNRRAFISAFKEYLMGSVGRCEIFHYVPKSLCLSCVFCFFSAL